MAHKTHGPKTERALPDPREDIPGRVHGCVLVDSNPPAPGRKAWSGFTTRIRGYRRRIPASVRDRDGVRGRNIDSVRTVYCTHTFPIPLREFTRRVKTNALPRIISRPSAWSCRNMFFNDRGQVICQVTHLAASPGRLRFDRAGAPEVRLCRLETITYRTTAQSVYWCMSRGTDESVARDEGMAVVSEANDRRTRCEIMVRYKDRARDHLGDCAGQAEGRERVDTEAEATVARGWICAIDAYLDHKPQPGSPSVRPTPRETAGGGAAAIVPSAAEAGLLFSKTALALSGIGFRAWLSRTYRSHLREEAADSLLEYALRALTVIIEKNPRLRANATDIDAVYHFSIERARRDISLHLDRRGARVRRGAPENPDVSIGFRDTASVVSFLLAPKPDILRSLLNQDIAVDGNVNYLFKFAYLANKLKGILKDAAPTGGNGPDVSEKAL